jgi:hypothetical protein
LARRNAIVQCEERRPDGANHDTNRVCTVHVLDCEPEDCEDGAGDNGDVRAPEAPGGAGNDGKRDMVENTDCTVKSNDEGDDEEGESDYAEGFAPCKTLRVLIDVRLETQDCRAGGNTNCNDTGCKLPCRSTGLVLASDVLSGSIFLRIRT